MATKYTLTFLNELIAKVAALKSIDINNLHVNRLDGLTYALNLIKERLFSSDCNLYGDLHNIEYAIAYQNNLIEQYEQNDILIEPHRSCLKKLKSDLEYTEFQIDTYNRRIDNILSSIDSIYQLIHDEYNYDIESLGKSESIDSDIFSEETVHTIDEINEINENKENLTKILAIIDSVINEVDGLTKIVETNNRSNELETIDIYNEIDSLKTETSDKLNEELSVINKQIENLRNDSDSKYVNLTDDFTGQIIDLEYSLEKHINDKLNEMKKNIIEMKESIDEEFDEDYVECDYLDEQLVGITKNILEKVKLNYIHRDSLISELDKTKESILDTLSCEYINGEELCDFDVKNRDYIKKEISELKETFEAKLSDNISDLEMVNRDYTDKKVSELKETYDVKFNELIESLGSSINTYSERVNEKVSGMELVIRDLISNQKVLLNKIEALESK